VGKDLLYGLPWRRFQNLTKSDHFGDFNVVVNRNLKNGEMVVNGCCPIGLLQFFVGRMWVVIKIFIANVEIAPREIVQ